MPQQQKRKTIFSQRRKRKQKLFKLRKLYETVKDKVAQARILEKMEKLSPFLMLRGFGKTKK